MWRGRQPKRCQCLENHNVVPEALPTPPNHEESPPHDPVPADSPPPIAPKVFDHLNAKLQQEDVGTVPKHQQMLLEQLGRQLRQWRMREGYTRQQLAEYLRINVDNLFCIENGIAVPGDIAEPSLRTLLTLLAQDELDISLAWLIRQYLISH